MKHAALPPTCPYAERVDAWVDGELEAPERALMEEHVAVCESCRRASSLARGLQRSLADRHTVPAPNALRQRIRQNLGSAAPNRWLAAPWVGWAAALLIGGLWLGRVALHQRQVVAIPMVQAAVADYRLHLQTELPAPNLVSLADEVGFPVHPLPTTHATLIAAWPVPIRGSLSAALAYRVGDQVVVEYVVRPALFFRQPVLRHALRRQGAYQTREGDVAVLAWPQSTSGALLVGRVPPAVLHDLAM